MVRKGCLWLSQSAGLVCHAGGGLGSEIGSWSVIATTKSMNTKIVDGGLIEGCLGILAVNAAFLGIEDVVIWCGRWV